MLTCQLTAGPGGRWAPAFAGATEVRLSRESGKPSACAFLGSRFLDSGVRRNDGGRAYAMRPYPMESRRGWAPACAGATEGVTSVNRRYLCDVRRAV